MTVVIGHDNVRTLLEANLPQVVSFVGPPSIGKRTLAVHLAKFHGFNYVDSMEFSVLFVAERAMQLRTFAGTAPFGEKKLAVIHLDKASEAALNDVLKLLEEPPAYMHFILIMSEPTLPTIMSRSHVYHLGRLSPEELTSVLIRFNGMSAATAARVSFAGQVSAARELAESVNDKATVLSVLRSVESKDTLLFNRSFKSVNERTVALLERALTEAATGSWEFFSAGDIPLFAKRPDVARKILAALTRTGSARRSLSARVVLEPIVRRN